MCTFHAVCCSLQGVDQCHSDIIRSIVCTDMGFIVTVSYDRAMYIYGEDHMTTPTRVRKASAARFTALAWDKANNWLLTGGADGCVKVWSQEGRILDELMHTSDQVCTFSFSLHAWQACQSCAVTCHSGCCVQAHAQKRGNAYTLLWQAVLCCFGCPAQG